MSNKLESFLQHVGADVKIAGADIDKVFEKVAPVVQAAEPYVNLVFPGFGPLFAATANEAISVEQKFAAAGQQSGTGKQKLASVLAVIEPVAAQLLKSANLPNDETTITNWINGVVGLLNGIPAPQSATPAAA